MKHTDLNILTAIAIAAVIIDLWFQISKVLKRHSSLDVSPTGVTIRSLASAILIVKFVSLDDVVLTVGQIIMSLTLFFYLAIVFRYHKFGKAKHAKTRRR